MNVPAALLKSTDLCSTWTHVGSADLPAAPPLGLSLDVHSPPLARTLFLTAEGDVSRSTDGGISWTRVLVAGGLRLTAVDPLDGNNVYAGGEQGLWRSTLVGVAGTWSEVGLPEMHGPQSGIPFWGWEGVCDIQPDPVRPGRVYVVVVGPGRGLYRSRDYGSTRQPAEAPLLSGDFLRRMAINPADPDILYVTSSSAFDSGGYEPGSDGVLRSVDGGQTWTPINDGLAWPSALPIVLNPTDASQVFIGAPGPRLHTRQCAAGYFGNPDGDRDVDISDANALLPCLAGPDTTPVDPQCPVFDADSDGDVDLLDVAEFQRAFTG